MKHTVMIKINRSGLKSLFINHSQNINIKNK